MMARLTWFVLTFFALTAPGIAQEDGFVALTPDQMTWQAAPGLEGVSFVALHGNPGQAGIYVLRVRFAPGVMSKPHFHDQDRMVTVISGTWAFGKGTDWSCGNTTPLGPGAYAEHPKGAIHFDGSCTDQPTVVEIRGEGPVSTTFVDGNE